MANSAQQITKTETVLFERMQLQDYLHSSLQFEI